MKADTGGEIGEVSAILENYKYLNKFFPADFIESLTEDNRSYRFLVDKDPRADAWRQEIDDCLELAYRYNLVDASLEARLKKGDRESWHATINELRVAKTLETFFGIDCLLWHPKGRGKKVGEFALVNMEELIFVEVKTVFPRDLERLEERIIEKLSSFAEQVPITSFLSVHLTSPGTSESFSGKKFKNFLTKELSAVNYPTASCGALREKESPHPKVRTGPLSSPQQAEGYSAVTFINPDDLKQKRIRLPGYKDDNTGLHLEIETLPIRLKEKEVASHIGVIGGEARFVANKEYIKHSLTKAYEQLPKGKQPGLVILCPSTAFVVDEDDMLNALLGSLAVRFYQSTGKETKVPEPETFRKPDGFYRPRRHCQLSATGLYQEGFLKNDIEQGLEICHNPFALNSLSESLFKGKGVRQLVKKNDQEMEWIE